MKEIEHEEHGEEKGKKRTHNKICSTQFFLLAVRSLAAVDVFMRNF